MTGANIIVKNVFIAAALAVLLLMAGMGSKVFGQRDPFELPAWKRPAASPTGAAGKGPSSGMVGSSGIAIEKRVASFKRERDAAFRAGKPLPKVTSILTIDEISVTGIILTPRGYSAIVEARPIGLSYSVHPGEQFFDGELVAIEGHRLVFRKVKKLSSGKFSVMTEEKRISRDSTEVRTAADQAQSPVRSSNRAERVVSPMSEFEAAGAKAVVIPDDKKNSVQVSKRD